MIGLTNFRLAAYGIPRAFLRATFLKSLLLNGTIGAGGITLLFGSCLAAFILICLLWLTVRRFKSVYGVQPTISSLLLAWLCVYGIFVLWWEPHNPEFWLPLLPPFWILLSSGTQGIRRAIPLLFLASIFLVNLAGEAIPSSSLKNNEPYQLVLKLRAEGVASRDLILIPDPVIEPYYLYFFDEGAMVSSLADMKLPTEEEKARIFTEVEERVEETLLRGGRVFVSESELEPNPRKLHPTRWLKVSDYEGFYQKYEKRLRKVFSYGWDGEEVDMFELEG